MQKPYFILEKDSHVNKKNSMKAVRTTFAKEWATNYKSDYTLNKINITHSNL